MKNTILFLVTILFGCQSNPPENLSFENTQWKTYTHKKFGFEIRYPAYYKASEHESEVIFRYDEFPVLLVRTVKPDSRKKDWLWPDEDVVGDFQINGENYAHYDYNHCDGPFCMRTLAYVKQRNENKIGVEFRTNNHLDKVQEEILKSFRLL